MKMKSLTPSRYIETFNINNGVDLLLFEWQLRSYFTEMRRHADSWRKPAFAEEVSLAGLDKHLYEMFGLTSQALCFLAKREHIDNWNRSTAIAIAQELSVVHLGALDGRLDVSAPDFQEIFKADKRLGMLLAVSSDPEMRDLKPFDYAGWARVLTKTWPGMRVIDGKPDVPQPKSVEIMLTKSQQELSRALKSFWKLKQSGACVAGYDARPIPLIVGPSGSGKSALVRHFAQENKLPMRDFNVGTWVITGAKAEPYTLGEISRFIEENDRGVLFIDEVDKLFGTADWARSLQQEVFALLDGRTDSFISWTDEVRAKFARNFFIVGAGTWQTLYARNRKNLGFQNGRGCDDWSIDLSEQTMIPDELLMRFNADVLYLKPLEPEEIAKRITSIVSQSGRGAVSEERLQHLTAKAHASGRHNRWLEAFASRILRGNMTAL